jgi:hypothetical protein
MATSEGGWTDALHFVLGKSLVGGGVNGDIFDLLTPAAIPFARPEVLPEPLRPDVSVELDGPWSYYAEFRRAHGLAHLPHPEPPEIALQAPGTLVIPLSIRNRTGKVQEITITATLPAGWTAQSGTGKFLLEAKQVAAARLEVNFPALAENGPKKSEAQEVTIRAESGGQSIGDVKLRVELRKRALPQ